MLDGYDFNLIGILFWVMCILGCGYAFFLGGREGRYAGASYLLAAIISLIVHDKNPAPSSVIDMNVLIVDLGYLAVTLALVFSSNLKWPIWIAGFHLASIAAHFAAMTSTGIIYGVYDIIQSFWSIPIILVMTIGVYLNKRFGVR